MSKADSGIINRAERREYLGHIATDHRFFVEELWKDRGLDKKAPLGDLEYEMLDWVYMGPRMRGILGARGMGKTTLLVAPLALYRLLRDPNRKVLVISKSATAAKETIGLCRSWLDYVWFLQHLKPQKDQPDNTNEFDVGTCTRGMSKQPSMKALGNDGMLEGNRANTFIMDDAETKGNTRTQEARELLVSTVANEATNIVYAKDDAIDPNEVIDIGTFKHEDSFHKRLSVRGYSFRTYPIAYPQKDDKFIGLSPLLQERLDSGAAHYTENGEYDKNPCMPHFFEPKTIRERMNAGLLDFGMENMLVLNPGKQTGPPLRLAQLLVMDIDRDMAPIRVMRGHGIPIGNIQCEGLPGDALYAPETLDSTRTEYQTTEACIDIAGEGNDLMGVSIAGYLNGLNFIKFCKGMRGGASNETLMELAMVLRRHGARTAHVETNIDVLGTFVPALQTACNKLKVPAGDKDFPRGWSCTVLGFHATGKKEIRICQVLVPLAGNDRIIVDPGVLVPDASLEASQTFQFQWTRIRPISKWLSEDGAIDSLASLMMKFQEITGGNRTDPEKNRNATDFRETMRRLKELNRKNGEPVEYARVFRHI